MMPLDIPRGLRYAAGYAGLMQAFTMPFYLHSEPRGEYFGGTPARREQKAGHYASCRQPNAKAKRRAQKAGRKASR